MSWNGTHPKPGMTKARARMVLAGGACKRCVYLARCLPTSPRQRFNMLASTCDRCGITIVPAVIVAMLESTLHIVLGRGETLTIDCTPPTLLES